MEVEEYARIAAAEADHWWYRGTRAIVADLLAPWLPDARLILDAGCGPGGNGAWLSAHGTVVGVDLAPDALAFVRARRSDTIPVLGSLEALPLAGARFDVAVAITVLYAVEDDAAALAELARALRPGGAVVLVEPAFEVFRRGHDAVVHGRRRYRRPTLSALARRAGLRVRRATYAYSFLAPPAAVLGGLDRLRRHDVPADSDSDVERRALDSVFAPLAAAERRVIARRNVPVGTSVVILATRD